MKTTYRNRILYLGIPTLIAAYVLYLHWSPFAGLFAFSSWVVAFAFGLITASTSFEDTNYKYILHILSVYFGIQMSTLIIIDALSSLESPTLPIILVYIPCISFYRFAKAWFTENPIRALFHE